MLSVLKPMSEKKMYRVSGVMTISVFVDVEAESEEEAKALSEDCGVMHLCHSCADGHEGEWSTSGELDGAPNELEAKEL